MDTGGQVGTRGETQAVHDSLETAPPADHGEVGELALEQHVLALAPQVAAVVERSGARIGQ